MKKILVIVLNIISLQLIAQNDIVVNGSGLPDTYLTISEAVQAASPGDKILVSNQSFPYQEDTLFIDKGVTILPYSDVSYIEFEGHIHITIDDIEELNLIGFNSYETNITSVFNDTTRNSLTTINITDCNLQDISLSHPKSSLYLSYSNARTVNFSHGDLIGNKLYKIIIGIHDYSEEEYTEFYNSLGGEYNYLSQNSSGGQTTDVCDLFENNIRFGNVETPTDNINIIANEYYYNSSTSGVDMILATVDFSVNIFNNKNLAFINIGLSCEPNIGTNIIANNSFVNDLDFGVFFKFARCEYLDVFNFQNVDFKIVNNSFPNDNPSIEFLMPDNNNNYSSNTLPDLNFGVSSYNNYNNYGFFNYTGSNQSSSEVGDLNSVYGNSSDSPALLVGPTTSNPSSEYLNLDLSLNTQGVDGGSYAWSNYHPNGEAGFGTMTGSKARITYLNIPTQIFDTDNIQIRARAVHGN